MKLSWPVSAREALVHFVSLDYFQDGLIIVLWNSVITHISEIFNFLPITYYAIFIIEENFLYFNDWLFVKCLK